LPKEGTTPLPNEGSRFVAARVAIGRRAAVLALTILTVGATGMRAQYFGKNKVQYRVFAFRTLETPHFLIYHYDAESTAARLTAPMAERWYARLARLFDHQLRDRQRVILYASPSDFQQTNAVTPSRASSARELVE
jgi:hypothetical protein